MYNIKPSVHKIGTQIYHTFVYTCHMIYMNQISFTYDKHREWLLVILEFLHFTCIELSHKEVFPWSSHLNPMDSVNHNCGCVLSGL